MKHAMLIGTGALLLVFGISAPAFAQEQHDPQDQPAKPPDAKPTEKPQAEPPKTPDDRPRPDNAAKPPKETEHKQDAQHAEDAKSVQHAGNGRIPDDKYKAHFGREHTFHVGHPTVVEGRPRFTYGGYSFIIAQPWPTGWGYDDDVYVIDVNGVYYLVDVAHPGVQLELQVVL
ncbi:MAG TPA: hypothetical protein VN902_00225 [Candidatus Acidoferrales bacterium]|jgi:hypothetical protein|nr:hypothetical protein [Candidatus Acidoferrales bacterium]